MRMNTERPDELAECLAVVHKAIYLDPPSMSERMDTLYGEEQEAFVHSMAMSRRALGMLRTSLTPAMAKEIAGVLLFIKAQNDILAGHLLLRCGYNKRAIYFIRLALESIAQGIIVFLDAEYYAAFKADGVRADKVISKLKTMLPLDGLDQKAATHLEWLCSKKNTMNLHSHSTVYAVLGDYVGMEPTFGPSFDHKKRDELRAIHRELGFMAGLIATLADWMKARK
jgi:hypothetical protein